MRLDKFLSVTKTATRSESSKAAKSGNVTVNGAVEKNTAVNVDPENDRICFFGQPVVYRKYVWIMMNKPSGLLSASNDKKEKTVVSILPPPLDSMELFPCGRLDKDTVGLIMITNDGELSHKLLSPKKHAEKKYFFKLSKPYDRQAGIENGIIMDGKLTKPARIEMQDELSGTITLTEGKYHQIKRMFERAGSKVIYLKRISFGGVKLDPSLRAGEWRYLTEAEEETLKKSADNAKGI